MMTELEQYYNKFCEEKRLGRRHGQVEYFITMKYIRQYLENMHQPCIIDIGAGTGRYSVQLAEEGYDVTAVELVKYNLGILKSKGSSVKAYHGNALKLSRFQDESFDLALLFGPMYHLYTMEDKVAALKEAGIFVRHFKAPERISNYLRITIGTRDEMNVLFSFLKKYRSKNRSESC